MENMTALGEMTVPTEETMARTEMVLKPFFDLGKVELISLLGRDFSKLKMTIDRANPDILDFKYIDPENNNVLMNMRAKIDESNHTSWIAVDFIHQFIDGSQRGFRLSYHPFEEGASDDHALSKLQILPKPGENCFPWTQYVGTGDPQSKLDTTKFPQEDHMICIKDIKPDMTFDRLRNNFPYLLKYVPDSPNVSLFAQEDGKHCKDPFEIALPAHIGLSKEVFGKTLQSIKTIRA